VHSEQSGHKLSRMQLRRCNDTTILWWQTVIIFTPTDVESYIDSSECTFPHQYIHHTYFAVLYIYMCVCVCGEDFQLFKSRYNTRNIIIGKLYETVQIFNETIHYTQPSFTYTLFYLFIIVIIYVWYYQIQFNFMIGFAEYLAVCILFIL